MFHSIIARASRKWAIPSSLQALSVPKFKISRSEVVSTYLTSVNIKSPTRNGQLWPHFVLSGYHSWPRVFWVYCTSPIKKPVHMARLLQGTVRFNNQRAIVQLYICDISTISNLWVIKNTFPPKPLATGQEGLICSYFTEQSHFPSLHQLYGISHLRRFSIFTIFGTA